MREKWKREITKTRKEKIKEKSIQFKTNQLGRYFPLYAIFDISTLSL